jgi:hypothetical protein
MVRDIEALVVPGNFGEPLLEAEIVAWEGNSCAAAATLAQAAVSCHIRNIGLCQRRCSVRPPLSDNLLATLIIVAQRWTNEVPTHAETYVAIVANATWVTGGAFGRSPHPGYRVHDVAQARGWRRHRRSH